MPTVPASGIDTLGRVDAGDAASFQDLLRRRRSVRRLAGGPLSEGALDRLAEAVRVVPAAYGRPSWRVVAVRDRRAAFWDAVEAGSRERLEPDQLPRDLDRLDGFRGGAEAVLVLADRSAEDAAPAAGGLSPERATAFAEQGLGMVQPAAWLAPVNEGWAASLQHWDWPIEDRGAAPRGLPAGRFRLAAAMPFGYPAEAPRPAADPPPVVSLDDFPAD